MKTSKMKVSKWPNSTTSPVEFSRDNVCGAARRKHADILMTTDSNIEEERCYESSKRRTEIRAVPVIGLRSCRVNPAVGIGSPILKITDPR